MFRGAFTHNLDDKSRVIIPQKFRLLLGEKFVITKGLDRCLWVFPDEEFRELDQRLKSMPMFDQDAVRLLRFFSADAIDASADAQGRVAIPHHLREFAGIEREVTIVGTGNRIEIWSKQRWNEFTYSMNEELIRESAKALGIG